MSNIGLVEELSAAVQAYFDLMYDCDTSRFSKVFRSTANLHGFRDGKLTAWAAEEYTDILANRASPKSAGAPRDELILFMDFASDQQALVKVRVRINQTMFFDYLTFHRIDNRWLITSKAYHGEPI